MARAAPELLFESIPETIPHLIDLFFPDLVLRVGPSELHPENHDRTRQCPAEGPSPSDAGSKTGCNLWQQGPLLTQVFLETQGDRFGSVESLVKRSFRPFRDHFFHVKAPFLRQSVYD